MTDAADTQLLVAAPRAVRRRGYLRFARGLARQPVALAAGVVLVAVFVIGAVAPKLTPPEGNVIRFGDRWINQPPALHGWRLFGTDNLGREMLVRTLYGLHTSEQTALVGTLLATALGLAIGAIAGYRGGWADALLMRLADMLGVFPALLLLLCAYAYLAPVSVLKATIIMACYLWIPAARIVRAEIASLRNREFVEAAVSLGASDRRIFFRHLLPNAASVIAVAATTLLGQLIMLEATVEFFGVGVSSASQPSLGSLIGDGEQAVFNFRAGWWMWGAPAAVLVLILVCANLFGDGVAEALRVNRRR